MTKLNKFRENYIPFTLARIYNGHIIDKMKLIDRKTTYAAQILKKTYTFKKINNICRYLWKKNSHKKYLKFFITLLMRPVLFLSIFFLKGFFKVIIVIVFVLFYRKIFFFVIMLI